MPSWLPLPPIYFQDSVSYKQKWGSKKSKCQPPQCDILFVHHITLRWLPSWLLFFLGRILWTYLNRSIVHSASLWKYECLQDGEQHLERCSFGTRQNALAEALLCCECEMRHAPHSWRGAEGVRKTTCFSQPVANYRLQLPPCLILGGGAIFCLWMCKDSNNCSFSFVNVTRFF